MALLTGQDTPTVEVQQAPSGYSQAHFKPEDFGAGLGTAIQKVGEQISEVQHQERMIRIAAAADDADLATANKLGELQANFHRLRGPDAEKNLAAHVKAIEKARDEGGANLGPLAKRMYEQQTRRRAEGMIIQSREFAGRQMDAWIVNTGKLKHEDAKQQAASKFTSPEELSKIIHEDMAKQGKIYERVHGVQGDDLAVALHKDVTEILESSLNGALATNTAQGAKDGKALLDTDIPGVGKVRDVIGGKRAEAWESAFKKNLGVLNGTEKAQEMRKRFGTNTEAGIKELERQYGKKEIDDDTFKHAKDQFVSTNHQIHQAREQGRADQYTNALTVAVKGYGPGTGKTIEDYIANNAKQWNDLDGQQQLNLRHALTNASNANAPKTLAQRQALAQLYDDVETGKVDYISPGGSSRLLNDYAGKLHAHDLDSMQNFFGHKGMASQGKTYPWMKDNTRVGMQMVQQAMGILGAPKKDLTEGQLDVMEQAREELGASAAAWAQKHPGVPQPKDGEEGWGKVVGKYQIKGKKPGVFGYFFGGVEATRAAALAEGVEWTPTLEASLVDDFTTAYVNDKLNNPDGSPPSNAQIQAYLNNIATARGATRVKARSTYRVSLEQPGGSLVESEEDVP